MTSHSIVGKVEAGPTFCWTASNVEMIEVQNFNIHINKSLGKKSDPAGATVG